MTVWNEKSRTQPVLLFAVLFYSVEKDLNKWDVEGAVPYNLHKNEFTLTA